jgi:DNA-binding XRE family transcriptional regulator
MIDISFGEWLRRNRKLLGLTQQKLAEQINCATITVRKIEAQQRRPSIQIAEQIYRILNFPATEHDAFIRFARGFGQSDSFWITGTYPWHSSTVPAFPHQSHIPTSISAVDDSFLSLDGHSLDTMPEAYHLNGLPVEIRGEIIPQDSQGVTSTPLELAYVLLLVPIKMLGQAEFSTVHSFKPSIVSHRPFPGEK